MNVNSIENPKFLKQLNIKQLNTLSNDIRKFLLENVSKTGGHLSSNLGIVELTIALHFVFDSPTDKFIFDVGHQSYVHKILTGRASQFNSLRQLNGLSGFQKRYESDHDIWEAGHSSTSISAATGMAISRDLHHEKYEIISIIGDASIANGESFEALNYLGSLDTKVIIILNDNNMSISKNVGGFSNILSSIRLSSQYSKSKAIYTNFLEQTTVGKKFFDLSKELKDRIKSKVMSDNIFSQFELDYLGPIDGHDFNDLITAFEYAKHSERSIVIHVKTKKGKGYKYAENDKYGIYHGVGPFDLNKGIIESKKTTYASEIANNVLKAMNHDKDIVCITPAMVTGSCLNEIFNKYPERSFDVGIAEEHAMTFAAGMSIQGLKPYIVIYSSFIQRCYDQINHDIARMNLPVLIGVDHAGLVGADGETHHGVFDLGILLPIPNLIIMTPSDSEELKSMIQYVFNNFNHPYVIRFPKSNIEKIKINNNSEFTLGTWTKYNYDTKHKLSIISYGECIHKIIQLVEEYQLPVDIINARFIKPMDTDMLNQLSNKKLLVYQPDLKQNGLGESILAYYNANQLNPDITIMGIGDHYTPQGSIEELLKLEELSMDNLKTKIEELLRAERKN